jgi:hypothetical protein
MSAYRSTGAFDDQILGDGDAGFVGVNQRLQLNQLQAGEVRESLNGRMEGYWKPRKGVLDRTSALTTGGVPLQLPFLLIDSAKSITDATIPATNTIRIEVTGHGFPSGSSGWAAVSGLAGDLEVNGNFLLTYYDVNHLEYTVSGISSLSDTTGLLSQAAINDNAAANVRASCLFSDPNSGNEESVIIALDTEAKKVSLADFSVTSIAYPPGQALGEDTDMIQVFDKVMLFRDGQQAFEWYPNGRPVISASQSGDTVTMKVSKHGLLAGASIVVTGLTGGVDANGTHTVLSVVDEDTFTFKLNYMVITGTLNPDATGTLPYAGIFGGAPYWQDPAGGTIIQWSGAPNNWWTIIEPTLPGFASWVSDSTTLAATPTPDLATNWVPGPSVVAPTATGTPSVDLLSQTVTFGITDAVATDGFTLSPGGIYTQPQTFNIQAKDVDVVNGKVTATVTGNTTVEAGDVIVVYTSETAALSHMVGKQFVVVSATTTTIEWYAPIGDYNTSSSDVFEFGGQFSVGAGFIHQPGAPWGVHFQRRLWVPFYYEQSGAYNSVTYTSRKITDEIAVSDILDTTTFDQISNQFRISGGTADYVVAMHGFFDDGMIVLNRNSLHIIQGTQGSLNDTVVKELTSEVGCLARKSIVMRGNAMFFLSDDGVYAVEFLDQYNLRGADEPISKNIQPYIDRISSQYADKAVGVIYENRYYLAVPLDSAPNAGDAKGNNSILVFNFLNKAWESLDTFGDTEFLIEDFIIGSADTRNNLYAVTANGGLHELEAVETANDRLNVTNLGTTAVDAPINARLTTRGYDFQNLDRKRFTDAQVNIQTLAGEQGEYEIEFAAEDPDAAVQIGTTSDFLGGELLTPSVEGESETASIRCRLGGVRGFTGTMILTRTVGSPKINSVKVSGSVTNRQIISQK